MAATGGRHPSRHRAASRRSGRFSQCKTEHKAAETIAETKHSGGGRVLALTGSTMSRVSELEATEPKDAALAEAQKEAGELPTGVQEEHTGPPVSAQGAGSTQSVVWNHGTVPPARGDTEGGRESVCRPRPGSQRRSSPRSSLCVFAARIRRDSGKFSTGRRQFCWGVKLPRRSGLWVLGLETEALRAAPSSGPAPAEATGAVGGEQRRVLGETGTAFRGKPRDGLGGWGSLHLLAG